MISKNDWKVSKLAKTYFSYFWKLLRQVYYNDQITLQSFVRTILKLIGPEAPCWNERWLILITAKHGIIIQIHFYTLYAVFAEARVLKKVWTYGGVEPYVADQELTSLTTTPSSLIIVQWNSSIYCQIYLYNKINAVATFFLRNKSISCYFL